MTTVRWIAVAWLVAFAGGIGAAWFVSGLTTADRDDAARVPAAYAKDISAARARQTPQIADLAPRDDGSSSVAAEGVGSGGVESLTLDADPYDLHVTYDGDGPLRIEARATADGQRWILVEQTGPWQGTIAFEPPVGGEYDVLVEASGAWSIEIVTTDEPAR